MLGFILALVAGAASPTQASVNARIREDLRSPYTTTLLNFIFSAVILALMVLAVERSLYLPLAAVAEQPFWIWLGGPCGTVIVLLNIICLHKLGSARNVMLICFGQIMTGLLVDNYGLFGSLQIPMSAKRLIGALLVIAGTALVNGISPGGRGAESAEDGSKEQSALSEGVQDGSVVLYAMLAVICGFACTAQIAINGTLSIYADTALKATLINSIAGFLATAVVIVAIMLVKGRYGIYDGGKDHGQITFRPWMPAGGALAIVIVGGNAIAAPLLGTGIVTILNLVAMMAVSLMIDATGFLGIEKKPITMPKIAGMILLVAGAALISF